MPAEKKLAALATVLVMGVGAALFFRKDASPLTTSAETIDGLVSDGALERRLPPTSQAENVVPVQTFRIPTAAAGLHDRPAPEFPPNNHALSPVGALLKPLTYDDESADTDSSEPTDPAAPTLHQVVDGDTLASLATKYLGTANRSQEIYEKNRDVLTNPDLLPIGKVLKIPARTESPGRIQAASSAAEAMPAEPAQAPLEKQAAVPPAATQTFSVPPNPAAGSPAEPG